MVKRGVDRKLERIADCLDRIESGRYSDMSIFDCCNYIGWVAKYKKAARSVWEPLCDKATRLLESGLC